MRTHADVKRDFLRMRERRRYAQWLLTVEVALSQMSEDDIIDTRARMFKSRWWTS